ncbi:SAF domain-containing protein [Nocardiopsis protaetiae]|uniref:SAF domain-containing protein n=1 Tax=Nocardiopsis protaetiae TaxID=3382270 RepID=UPI00387B15B5
MIVAGVGLGAWAGWAGEDTVQVAVVEADLPAGHELTGQDVTTVEAAPAEGLHLLSTEDVTGMVLAQPVPAGTPLVEGALTEEAAWPEPGTSLLAVPVATVPRGLTAGMTVDVIPSAPGGDPAPEVVSGLVHHVTSHDDGFGTGGHVVEVLVPRDRAAALSHSLAGEAAHVALVNRQDALTGEEEAE